MMAHSKIKTVQIDYVKISVYTEELIFDDDARLFDLFN